MLCTILTLSQTKKDSTTQKEIKEEVVWSRKKLTVESNVDRTVFNVANSSIWQVIQLGSFKNKLLNQV